MKLNAKIFLGFGILILILSVIVIYNVLILNTSHTLITKILDKEAIITSQEATLSLKTLQDRFLTASIILVVFIFIGILAGIVTAIIISGSVINPVHILAQTMQEVEKGNYESRVNIKSRDEFRDLANRFNNIIRIMKKSRKQSNHHQDRNRRETELALRIQTSTCPLIPAHNELEIAASMSPVDDVGGDYYDLVLDKDNNLWIGIGDVSGNGITPGLIVLMAETAFNTYVQEKGYGATPKDAIISINKVLTDNIRTRLNQNYFMSMNFLKYTGSGQFLQSGSHLDILVYRGSSEKCDLFSTDGVYMGIIPDISAHTEDRTFHLDRGDAMVVYTNGIIEAKNKNNIEQLLGIDALINTIIEHGKKEASKIMEAIREHSLKWCGYKPVDDMTVVVAKRVK